MSASEILAKTESVAQFVRSIRSKELSPVEGMAAAISRIEAYNSKINALVISHFEQAMQAAKVAEVAIMRGEAVGPLHGVPVAMKDCSDFKPGWVTTFGGVRGLANYVAKNSCAFVERMEKAGAIIVGKVVSE
jgi:amidase